MRLYIVLAIILLELVAVAVDEVVGLDVLGLVGLVVEEAVCLDIDAAVGYLEIVFPLQFDAVVDSSSKLGECLVMSLLAALVDSPSELCYGEGEGEGEWLMCCCCCDCLPRL